MKYFDHDTSAAKDELIQALRIALDGSAVDTYWTILECIYREETDLVIGENRPITKSLTHWLCIDWETFKTQFSTMSEIGLIDVVENPEEETFTLSSARASETIAKYKRRAETARENGKNGGRPKGSKTTRKPRKTESVKSDNPEKPKRGNKEKEKLLDTHKGYPNNYASGDAAAADAAPPAAFTCPTCGVDMQRTNMRVLGTKRHIWRCPLCYSEVSE